MVNLVDVVTWNLIPMQMKNGDRHTRRGLCQV